MAVSSMATTTAAAAAAGSSHSTTMPVGALVCTAVPFGNTKHAVAPAAAAIVDWPPPPAGGTGCDTGASNCRSQQ